MSGKYDDIINLPHHVSKSRPQMSIASRAPNSHLLPR